MLGPDGLTLEKALRMPLGLDLGLPPTGWGWHQWLSHVGHRRLIVGVLDVGGVDEQRGLSLHMDLGVGSSSVCMLG